MGPPKGPEIVGLRPEYTSDETVDVTCKSERSHPAAELNFLINDEPVSYVLS